MACAARLPTLSRRAFLRHGARAVGALGAGLLGGIGAVGCFVPGGKRFFGALEPPDANGLRLPVGFASRIVAVSGSLVGGTGHTWHGAPDGGAVFPAPDGGWVYVSNSEISSGGGGVGALRFSAAGDLVDAYAILTGTHRNCAGGPTPWDTWLSCEEVAAGRVYECDPFAPGSQGMLRAALGTFSHEAAAVDPLRRVVYLSEDRGAGLLYRFTPGVWPSLDAGLLEAAEILDPDGLGPIVPGQTRPLAWHTVPEPNPTGGGVASPTSLPITARATRFQVPEATPFAGGEGLFYAHGRVVLTTKGDDRVWEIDTVRDEISILYDRATSATPLLSGVDNVTIAPTGDVYVAEDPGNLEIVALTTDGEVKPIVQVTGQPGSEVTGPALSPDGHRLYFSSQRPGTTYEVTGPFVPQIVWPAPG